MGKRENAGNQHFFFFSNFFRPYVAISSRNHHLNYILTFIVSSTDLQMLSICYESKFSHLKRNESNIKMFLCNVQSNINPLPNKPWFLHVGSTSLLKTLWEKEKLLVTSSFSFSHSVFYLIVELPAIFIKFEIVVCKLFQFGRV